MPIDNGIFGLQVTALLHDIKSRQVNADVVCQCQMACEILSGNSNVPARHSAFGHVTVLLSLLSMLSMCLAGCM